MRRCLSYRESASGYILIDCRGIVAMQMRSSQLDLKELNVASRDWLDGCFDVSSRVEIRLACIENRSLGGKTVVKADAVTRPVGVNGRAGVRTALYFVLVCCCLSCGSEF